MKGQAVLVSIPTGNGSGSAALGYLPHKYHGMSGKAGPIVVAMSPPKALMLAEALIHNAYGFLILDHIQFLC